LSAFNYQEDESGCWIWQGYVAPSGYGRIYNRDAKRIEYAHRYSYALHGGQLLPGHEIDHLCQVTRCVNPAHLDQVTRLQHAKRTMQRLGKDNVHDAAAQLRRSGLTYKQIAELLGYTHRNGARSAVESAIEKGLIDPEDVPRSKHLTEQEREDIRLMRAFGFTHPQIGAVFGIDASQVSRICNGRTSGWSRKEAS
jgi:hypothetical protein